MPKAIKHPTPEIRPPHAEPPQTGGDNLIVALAAYYRDLRVVHGAFDDLSISSKTTGGSPHVVARNFATSIAHREFVILDCICSIPATGALGAMCQAEVLNVIIEGGEGDPTPQDGSIREAAIWSIYRVLKGICGKTSADALTIMEDWRDPLRTDFATLADDWRAADAYRAERHPPKAEAGA